MKKNILAVKQYFNCIKTKERKLIATFFMLLGTAISTSNTLCRDILSASEAGVGDTLAYACNGYREWFPFIFVISGIICLSLSPNSKAKPVFKFIFFGSMAAYALSLGYNILTGTLDIILLKFGIGTSIA